MSFSASRGTSCNLWRTDMEPERKTAEPRQVLAAAVTFFLGWIYVDAFFYGEPVWLLVFTAAFTLTALLLHRERAREGEHWLWLGCLWLMLLCYLYGPCRAWEDLYIWLFLHACAAYWVLSLSGLLAEGKSGMFLLWDGLCALALYPLVGLCTFLRTRVLIRAARQIDPRKDRNWAAFGYGAAAVAVGGILLVSAGHLLSQADAGFGELLSSLIPRWNSGDLDWYIARFIFISLPVGGYLYGLLAGSRQTQRELSDGMVRAMGELHGSLSKVPNGVWTAVTGCFVALYLLFFGVQSSYLFGAFTRSLPEGFTVAQYARQGFFELCRCMGLNFMLLWLVCRSSRVNVRTDRLCRWACTALLVLSLALAVTAMSKLLLYIDCFGFTPLRLQSFWGVTVLAAGCVCCLVWLWTGRKTAAAWVYLTFASLALLHLY